MEVVQLQDIYNNSVFVEPGKIVTAMESEEICIYGRTLSELGNLIAFYEELGGEYPVTDEAIQIVRASKVLTS
jgi:hypothetical protein